MTFYNRKDSVKCMLKWRAFPFNLSNIKRYVNHPTTHLLIINICFPKDIIYIAFYCSFNSAKENIQVFYKKGGGRERKGFSWTYLTNIQHNSIDECYVFLMNKTIAKSFPFLPLKMVNKITFILGGRGFFLT